MLVKKHLENIEHMRGVMTMLVVLGHALTIFTSDYAGHNMIRSAFGSNLRAIIYSFHMPVFMAISGFLFYFEIQKCVGKGGGSGYGKFVKKKAKRLLIPFAAVMYLWRKPMFLFSDADSFEGMSLIQILKSYFSFQTTGALWFLYVLFIIFAGQRLLVNLIWKSEKTIIIWTGVFALFNIGCYKISGPIHHVMVYNYYFFLGAIVHRYWKKIGDKEKAMLPVLSLITVLGTFFLLVVHLSGIWNEVLRITISSADILLAFIVSTKFYHFLSEPVRVISNYSMGIYLFHEPLIVAVGGILSEAGGGGKTGIMFYGNQHISFNGSNVSHQKSRVEICHR